MQTNHQARLLERGSAVSFIIVGIVLAGLLIGGIALIKSRANHVANTPPQTVQTAQDQGKSTKESTPTTSQSTPTSTEPVATTPPSTSSTPTTTPTTSSAASSAGGAAIASTGPTETFTTMLILGFMTAILVRYLQSRTQTVRQ